MITNSDQQGGLKGNGAKVNGGGGGREGIGNDAVLNAIQGLNSWCRSTDG